MRLRRVILSVVDTCRIRHDPPTINPQRAALAAARAVGDQAALLLNEAHFLLRNARIVAAPPPSDRWFALAKELEASPPADTPSSDPDRVGEETLNAVAMFLMVEASDIDDQASLLERGDVLADRLSRITDSIGESVDVLLARIDDGCWDEAGRESAHASSPVSAESEAAATATAVTATLAGTSLGITAFARARLRTMLATAFTAFIIKRLVASDGEPVLTSCADGESLLLVVLDMSDSMGSTKLPAWDLAELIDSAVQLEELGGTLVVVDRDGATVGSLSVDGDNRVQAAMQVIHEAQQGTSDVLAALHRSIAGRPSGRLIVVSDGLSTIGPLDLRTVGRNADLNRLAQDLKDRELLPDLTGWQVYFSALGQSVELRGAGRDQRRLTELWRSVIRAAGGETVGMRLAVPDNPGSADDPDYDVNYQPSRAMLESLQCARTALARDAKDHLLTVAHQAELLSTTIANEEASGSIRHRQIGKLTRIAAVAALAAIDFPLMLWLTSSVFNVDWTRGLGQAAGLSIIFAGLATAGVAGMLLTLGLDQRRNKDQLGNWRLPSVSAGTWLILASVAAVVILVGLVATSIAWSVLALDGIAKLVAAALPGILSVTSALFVFWSAFRDGSATRDELSRYHRQLRRTIRQQELVLRGAWRGRRVAARIARSAGGDRLIWRPAEFIADTLTNRHEMRWPPPADAAPEATDLPPAGKHITAR